VGDRETRLVGESLLQGQVTLILKAREDRGETPGWIAQGLGEMASKELTLRLIRATWRAALFLWMTPLDAAVSTIEMELSRCAFTSSAFCCSMFSSSFFKVDLRVVRMCRFRIRRFSFWRILFFADL